MKQVAVLGLGDFGAALVRELKKNKVTVLAVDVNRARAESLKQLLDHVVVADITQASALSQMGLAHLDEVVVATSSPLSVSVLTILRLRELGVKRVTAKAENEDHAQVLRALGVENIIIPEHDAANRLANKISWSHVVEMVELSSGCSIMEVAAPKPVVGKLLRDSGLRERYNVQVLAIRPEPGGALEVNPGADHVIEEGTTLVVFGADDALQGLRKSLE